MARKSFRRSSDILLGHIELNKKQREYRKIITDENTRVVFLNGLAGTSKTFLSLYCALDLYNKNSDSNFEIIYLRTVVESASRSLGFLKGTEENKLAPYLEPMEGILGELLNSNERAQLNNKNVLQGMPVNFLRGCNFNNSVVILDEANNATFKEILTVVTRLNKNCTIIVAGDPQQSDIRNSGFQRFYDLFNDEESEKQGIYCLEFGIEDIKRDPVVGYILDRVNGSAND